jgi:hypothetical protein
MVKYVVVLCLVTAGLIAGPYNKADIDVAKIAPELTESHPGSHIQTSRGVCYVDSALNGYGWWTSMQDCIKGTPDGTIVMLMRRTGDGTLGSGALGLVWSVDGGQSWTADWPLNDGLLNDPHPGQYFGRYPTGGIATDFPYGSWPELLAGGTGWGYAGVGNEIDWSTPGFYGVFSSTSVGCHKNWSWERGSDAMIVGMAQDEGDNNHTWIYDPLLGDFDTAPTAQPQLAGFSTYALDYRDGDWLTVGFHSSLGALAYSTSDNGYDNWTTPDSLNPPGAPAGWTVYWIDGAYMWDGASPMALLGLDATGGLDEANEVWFFMPDTAIRLDAGMDTYNHYPQFALDAATSTIWVFWCEATHDTMDPAVNGWWHDIYYCCSMDGGYTWSTPEAWETEDINECQIHVSRYNGSFCYVTTIDDTQGDIYYGILADVAPYNTYECKVFVDTNAAFGVVESDPVDISSGLDLSVRNVMSERSLDVEFTLPMAGEARIQVYNEAGRSVLRHVGTYGEGAHMETFGTSYMPAGTYFLRLDAGELSKTAKFVMLR